MLKTGTSKNDTLVGSIQADELRGLAGTDLLQGLAGNDTLYGGDGTDTLYGDDGDDILYGEQGTDKLYGGAGRDRLVGGLGDDSIDGGAGVDEAQFSGSFANYSITTVNGITTVRDLRKNGDGTDTIINVERLRFSDRVVYLVANNAPVANADTGSTTEKTPLLGGSVLANDTDADLDPLVVTKLGSTTLSNNTAQITLASGAIVTINANGTYTYNPNGKVNYLAAGESTTDSFQYSVSDGQAQNASSTATVTITINGTNDAPVLAVAAATGAVTETTGTPAGGAADLTTGGAIAFGDVDVSDVNTVGSVTLKSVDGSTLPADLARAVGTLSAAVSGDTTTTASGAIDWSYTVAPGLVEYLAKDQTLTLVYTVAIADGHGGTAAKDVTVTVTGTNDAPVIAVAAATGAVTETAGTPAGGAADLTTGGAIAFGDVDVSDVNTVGSVTLKSVDGSTLPADLARAVGTLSAAVSGDTTTTASGAIDWSYTVAPGLVEYLAKDQTLTLVYTVAIADGHGGTAAKDVTVTVTGTNDAPVLRDFLIAANAGEQVTGTLRATDVDHDALAYSVIDGPAHGALHLNADGTFTYTAQGGYSGADSFVVGIDDGTTVTSTTATVAVAAAQADVRYITERINERVDSSDGGKNYGPAVAAVGSGHVVTWSSINPSDGNWDVYAQRYDASGAKVGGEFIVNTSIGYQYLDAVAGFADGTFVVAWSGYSVSGEGVFAQRFDAAGAKVGGEIQISAALGNEWSPSITALAGGKFAVTWQTYDTNSADGFTYNDVQLRVFNADGTAATGAINVSQTTNSSYQDTQGFIGETVTQLANGNIAVTWYSDQNGEGDIYTRVFTPAGAAVSDESRVSSAGSYEEIPSVAALADGDYIVVYDSSKEGDSYGIYAQRYNADGTKDGGEVHVNSWTNSYQAYAKAAALGDGGYAIVWQSYGVDGDNTYSISGQRYAANGTAVGTEFIVNANNGTSEQYPSIALREDGALVVAWQANNRIEQKVIDDFVTDTRWQFIDERVDSSGGGKIDGPAVAAAGDGHLVTWSNYNPSNGTWDIYAQRYDAGGAKLGGEFVVNSSAGYQYYDAVAGYADGSFVVAWNGDGASGEGIYAQRFDAAGAKLGGEILISETTGNEWYPSITALAGGQFAVTWRTYDTNNADGFTYYDVNLRVFNADGTAATGAINVSQTTDASYQETFGFIGETVTQLANGNIAVTWYSDQNGEGDVYTRVFTPAGAAVSDESRVSSAGSYEEVPSVAALADGDYIVVYESDKEGDNYGIYAQRYNADGTKDGGEVHVNSWTYSFQGYAKAAALGDGGYAIIWQSYGVDGDNTYSISGQRYAADGTAVGTEFVVNADNNLQQQFPSIALRADGALVVAWQTNDRIEQKIIDDFVADTRPVSAQFLDERVDSTGGSKNAGPAVAAIGDGHVVTWNNINPSNGTWDIYAQRYDAAGAKLGGEFVVNSSGGYQYYDAVAGNADGSFVVAWSGDGASGFGVYAQRFDAAGAKLGGEILISETTGDEWHPSITALAGGHFAVTWRTYDTNGADGFTYYDVQLRVFNADGTAATGAIDVSQTTNASYQDTQGWIGETVTQLTNGNIAVTWYSDQNGEGDVYTRVFTTAGVAVSDESRVSSAGSHEEIPSVAALADGDYIVVYDSNKEGDNYGIYAQRYNADGTKDGGEVHVNSWTGNFQGYPKAAALGDGGYAIVWQSYGVDGDNTYSISGQRYAADGTAVGAEFVVNADNNFDQQFPSIALRADGALIVAWQTGDRIEQKIIDDFTGTASAAKVLVGTDGNDFLVGSTLADTFTGGLGNDALTGHGGADKFVFADGSGHDTIGDWSQDDVIDLSSATGLSTFGNLAANNFHQVGADLLIEWDGGDVTLLNVLAADIQPAQIIL